MAAMVALCFKDILWDANFACCCLTTFLTRMADVNFLPSGAGTAATASARVTQGLRGWRGCQRLNEPQKNVRFLTERKTKQQKWLLSRKHFITLSCEKLHQRYHWILSSFAKKWTVNLGSKYSWAWMSRPRQHNFASKQPEIETRTFRPSCNAA